MVSTVIRNWLEACVVMVRRNIVSVRVAILQALFFEQIDGPSMRLAVDADIGDGIEPDLRGGLDGA